MPTPSAPFALLLLLAGAAAQDRPFRVVPAPPPEPPPSSSFPWPTDHVAAAQRARERAAPLLLYFTAKWCGPCSVMDRTTFVDAAVCRELGDLVAAKLDIDLPANSGLFARYGDGSVPGFAFLAPDGSLVHGWSGSGDPAQFLGEIATGRSLFADPVGRQKLTAEAALLVAVLRADEVAVTAAGKQLDEFAGPTKPSLAERLHQLGSGCRTRQQWTELAAVAARLLAIEGLSDDLRADAEIWFDESEFHTRGVVPERLSRRIDAWIDVMAEPFPGSSLTSRLRRLAGREDGNRAEAAQSWVRRANETRGALVRLGKPAFQPLLAAMRRRPEVAEDCAIVLGRMKLPGTAAAVRSALEIGELPAAMRTAHVRCLAVLKDAQCRPWLLEYAAAGQPVPMRTAAIDGLKDLALLTGDQQNVAVAKVVAEALRARDRGLCAEALQAAFQVDCALPLEVLDDLLDDRRPLFEEYVVADNAMWILCKQLGVRVVDGDGVQQGDRATPAAVAALRNYLREHEERLVWSSELRRYRVAE
jgi:hypothetical protein